MQIPILYSSKPKQAYVEHGLAERSVKKLLEKQGWEVWRSENISITYRDDLFPNVKKKYLRLVENFKLYFPEMLDELFYVNAVHHGMPDFVCFRHGICKFVECKRGYESLKENQIKTISRLQSLCFDVEVMVIANPEVKMKRALLLADGKKVLEVQQRLKKQYKAKKRAK